MAKKKVVNNHSGEKKNSWKGFQLAGLAGTVMVMAFTVVTVFSGSANVGESTVEARTRRLVPTTMVRPTGPMVPVKGDVKCLDTQRMCSVACPMTKTVNGCECVCDPAY